MDGSTVHWKGTHPKKNQNETETNDRGLELDCREGSAGLRQTDGEYSSTLPPMEVPYSPSGYDDGTVHRTSSATLDMSSTSSLEGPAVAQNQDMSSFFWYHPPIQIRDHHEPEKLLHDIEWGDLFFDLNYVAAAYKIGGTMGFHLLPEQSLAVGVLSMCSLFLNFVMAWLVALRFRIRFHTVDNFHGILEKVEFILIGLAVYFLPFHPSNLDEDDVGEEEVHRDDETPTDALRTHSVYGRGCMACFALYYSVYLFKWTEIWCDAQQRPGARFAARFQALQMIAIVVFFTVVWAVILRDKGSLHDIFPGWLLLPPLFYMVSTLLFVITFLDWIVRRKLNPQNYEVPLSTKVYIGRSGELVILLLGESVLSLILATENFHDDIGSVFNIVTFSALMLNAALLQINYFCTYPTVPENHAFRTNRGSGMLFLFVSLFGYCSTLLAAGVGAKYILKHTAYDNKPNAKVASFYCNAMALNNFFTILLTEIHKDGSLAKLFQRVEARKCTVMFFLSQVLSILALIILGFSGDSVTPAMIAVFSFVILCFSTSSLLLQRPRILAAAAKTDAPELEWQKASLRRSTSVDCRDNSAMLLGSPLLPQS